LVIYYYDDKIKGMRGARDALRMGEMRNAHKILIRNLKGRDHLKDLGVDSRRIL
jgi:hypothetical protein